MRAKRHKPDLKEITWEEETPNQGGKYRSERSPLNRYSQAQIEACQQWIRVWDNSTATFVTPPEPTPEQRRARRYGWYRDLENNYTRNR